ncbi:MAG: type II secretion system protein [Sulfurospirillaceae bacterium]|nr:type II secretion system protein [Sulfurospirillaceae bacterium]
MRKDIKKAFTLIELIFTIVLMGALLGIGTLFIPDNRLLNDTNYVVVKVKERQKNAIGYDRGVFGGNPWQLPVKDSSDFNLTCIRFDKDYLEKSDKAQHSMYSQISISPDVNKTLCFDELGRPFQESERLLLKPLKVELNYKANAKSSFVIMPVSGYVVIK